MRKVFLKIILLLVFLFSATPTFAAVSWNQTQPLGDQDLSWTPSAISSNGQTMIVGDQDGGLLLSTNGGSSWTQVNPSAFEPPWYTANMSSNGQIILVGAYTERLYISRDGGNNWSETRPVGDNAADWIAASMAPGGQVMLVSTENGRLYKTTDVGNSWSEIRPVGDVDRTWYTALSSDGQIILATGDDGSGGRLYISRDSGNTWTETRPYGDIDHGWRTVGMSLDGQVMLAGIYGEKIFLSTDGGASWSEVLPPNSTSNSWIWSIVSDDGKTLLIDNTQRLYISTDRGNTWTETQPMGDANGTWQLLSMSGNAQVLLAGNYNGRLYLGSNPPTASTASSGSNSPSCNTTPTSPPDLFQINTGNNTATLYFSPVGQSTNYVVSYGFTPQANQFSALTNQGSSTGIMVYAVNALPSNATMYFKVYAQNDCGQGVWSNTMTATTTKQGTTTFYKNVVSQILSVIPQKTTVLGAATKKVLGAKITCQTYTVKAGDVLWSIASEKLGSGAEYQSIMTTNKLESTALSPGQKLKVGC